MNQQGFAHVLAIVAIVGLLGTVSTVGYVAVRNNAEKQETKNAADTTDVTKADDNIAEVKEVEKEPVEQKKEEEKKTEPAPAPPPTPAPTPTPAPAPAPKPAPKALSAADCNGTFTAYVIASGGAPVSFQYPDNWKTHKTYPKGTKLTVFCETGNTAFSPEYGLTGDAFIKMSQLSKTAP